MSGALPLSSAFVANLPPGAPAAQPSPLLEGRLAALLQKGREAWPQIEVDSADLCAALAARAPVPTPAPTDSGAALCAYLDELKAPADLYLAQGCLRGVDAAIQQFERAYLVRVPEFLARLRQSETFVQEVQQLLREHLLVRHGDTPPRIADYAGRSPLSGWLRIVAVNRALNLMRAEGKTAPSEDDVGHAIADVLDPERRYFKAVYRAEVQRAVREAFAELPAEQRRLLRLYFVGKLGVIQLGELFSTHHTTISRRLRKAIETVGEHVQGALSARLGMESQELPGLLSLVRSQLELSINGMLASVEKPGAGER